MTFNARAFVRFVSVVILLVASSSISSGNPLCDVSVTFPTCTDDGLLQSSFPNDFGHSSAPEAESAFTRAFDSDTLSDSCSADLSLFACLLYFPECRTLFGGRGNIVRRPCRDFCERMQADCANVTALRNVSCDFFSFWDPASPTACYDPFHLIVINEVDVKTSFSDRLQMVELWDYGIGSTKLNGFVFVVGSDSPWASEVIDLSEETTSSTGFYGKRNRVFKEDSIFTGLPSGTGAVSIYRGPISKFSPNFLLTSENVVDAVVFHTVPGIISSLLIGLYYTGQKSLLDTSIPVGSISRCISFRPRTSSAFLFVSASPGLSNSCSPRHLQTTITRRKINIDRCCVNTSVFCAFNLLNGSSDDGYCQSRTLWKRLNAPSHLTANILKSAACSPSTEALATIQPFFKQNILEESCPIAAIERARATLISTKDKRLRYSSVERVSAEKTPNCSVSVKECEVYFVSSLINNSISEVDVSANCGQNVIGFTVEYQCLGTSEFPCLTGKPWKFVAHSTSTVTVEVLCPSRTICSIISEGNTATLDAPNAMNEYIFNVRPLPEGSTFTFLEEFRVELFYNDDLKATLDVPVVEDNAIVYRAFTLLPSQGEYDVLNKFE